MVQKVFDREKQMSLEGRKVAVVALGSSFYDFVMSRMNSNEFDEIWGINSVGGIFHVDRTFMMDPAARFLDDDKAGTQTGIGREFLLATQNKGPIYSCCTDDRVPEIEHYPLEEVVTYTGYSYFNNTVAYAIAFAIWQKVGTLHLYGMDFSYKQNVHLAEAGRSCVEFWCAIALSKGIKIEVAPKSGLLDTNVPIDEKLYGYHRLEDPLVQTVVNGDLFIGKKSESEKLLKPQQELTPPEPKDGVVIGRHDIKGVNYD